MPAYVLGSPLRVLVQLPTSDQLIPRAAQGRLAVAFVRGSAAETPVTLLGDDIFGLGLPTSNSLSALNLAFIEGRHGVLLDFEDPTATVSAQAQAATFLAGP